MKLKVRACQAGRPAMWALTALLALALAPAAAAETPPAGSDTGTRGSDRPASLVELGTGFHQPGASERVREVQRRLNRLGYGAGAVDGLFGPMTDAAVRRFQSESSLAVDGAVGPRTLQALRSRIKQNDRLLARGSGFTRLGPSERVREVQRTLNRLGYGAGAVDGLFGPSTDAAVRRFQSERTLAVDGIAGPRTLRALGAPSEPSRQVAEERRAPPRSQARRQPASSEPEPASPRPTPSRQPAAPVDPVFPPAPGGEGSGLRWEVILPMGAVMLFLLVMWFTLRTDQPVPRKHEGEGEAPPAAEPELDLPAALVGSRHPPRGWRAELVDVPHAKRLLGVGARADLVGSPGTGSEAGMVYVEIELFAEGQEQRWETDPLDGGAPFSVSVDGLEESTREIVVPERLPALARVLRNVGIDVQPGDLEVLPFMLELSPELERELARRSGRTWPVSSSQKGGSL